MCGSVWGRGRAGWEAVEGVCASLAAWLPGTARCTWQIEWQLRGNAYGATPNPTHLQDAAELLQSIGWWEPHLQLNLLSAGVSERFTPELEVRGRAGRRAV